MKTVKSSSYSIFISNLSPMSLLLTSSIMCSMQAYSIHHTITHHTNSILILFVEWLKTLQHIISLVLTRFLCLCVCACACRLQPFSAFQSHLSHCPLRRIYFILLKFYYFYQTQAYMNKLYRSMFMGFNIKRSIKLCFHWYYR